MWRNGFFWRTRKATEREEAFSPEQRRTNINYQRPDPVCQASDVMRNTLTVIALFAVIFLGLSIGFVMRISHNKDMEELANELISFSGQHGGRLPNSWPEFVEFDKHPDGWSVEELISIGHLRWGYSVFDRPPDGKYIYITGSTYKPLEPIINDRLGAYVRNAAPIGSHH
jgi:hypothetical protein